MQNPIRPSGRVPKVVSPSRTRSNKMVTAPKYTQIDTNVPKTNSQSVEPKFRITLPMQLQIIRLFAQGCSRREISRRTRRSRQTIAKVLKFSVIGPMKRQELKEELVGTSDGWLESISYAQRFEQKHRPCNDGQARALGTEAVRRSSALSLEGRELAKLVSKD